MVGRFDVKAPTVTSQLHADTPWIIEKWCALGDDFRTFCASQTVAELQHLAFSVGF
jgi:hypothetical protein